MPHLTLNVAIVFFSPPKAYMQTVNIWNRDEIRGERTALKNNTRAHQHSPHQTIFGFVKKSTVFSESWLSRGFGLSISGVEYKSLIFFYYENIKINDIKISFYKTLHLVQKDLVMRYIIVFPRHVEDSLL